MNVVFLHTLSRDPVLQRARRVRRREFRVEDTYGAHSIKLPAGDMVLYPSTSLHHVRPVTRGIRTASFFWIQSMVRDDGERALLFDLDQAIQQVNADALLDRGGMGELAKCEKPPTVEEFLSGQRFLRNPQVVQALSRRLKQEK